LREKNELRGKPGKAEYNGGVKRGRAIVSLHYFPPTVFRPLLPSAVLAINVFSPKEASVFLFQKGARAQPGLLLLREGERERERERGEEERRADRNSFGIETQYRVPHKSAPEKYASVEVYDHPKVCLCIFQRSR